MIPVYQFNNCCLKLVRWLVIVAIGVMVYFSKNMRHAFWEKKYDLRLYSGVHGQADGGKPAF